MTGDKFTSTSPFVAKRSNGVKVELISNAAAVYGNGLNKLVLKRRTIPQVNGKLLNTFIILHPLYWTQPPGQKLSENELPLISADLREAMVAFNADCEIYRELPTPITKSDIRRFRLVNRNFAEDGEGTSVNLAHPRLLTYRTGDRSVTLARSEGIMAQSLYYNEIHFETPIRWDGEDRTPIAAEAFEKLRSDIALAFRQAFDGQCFFYIHQNE